MEQIYSPGIYNSLEWPELTTYGSKLRCEMYPTRGNQPLGCLVSVKTDADKVPAYFYWIVKEIQENGNAANILEPGDWIISINGASTTDNDKSFLETVKLACQSDILILVIRKPLEKQECYVWDPNPVTVDIKVRDKRLPFSVAFSLDIFYPDLHDSKKTYAVVDNIKLPKMDLKGLKRGDIIISINKHGLQDKTYEEMQQIVHQLSLRKQIKLTIQRRQWRQTGHLTALAITTPEYVGWRPLLAELKRRNQKEPLGLKFVFAENQLEQPCPIIKQIAAGETPAARSPYLSPGCKIKAINGYPVKGLSFDEVKARLQKPQASVILSIEEPTSLLHEENDAPSGERRTWPVETENGCLRKSSSIGQIRYTNSFEADGFQSVDLCQKVDGTLASNSMNDAEPKPLTDQGKPASYTLPLPSDHYRRYNGEGISSRYVDCHQLSTPPLAPLLELCDNSPDHDLPAVCQNCLTITLPNKPQQSIEHIPWEIYRKICLKLDKETHFIDDYHSLGEKLGFLRGEISLLGSKPTDSLLTEWNERNGKHATIGMLMNILVEMERHDTLQLLQSWVENCPKCFAYEQPNVKESYV